MSETRRVNEIVVSHRVRSDVGNLLVLMGSIERVGLLHPVVINTRNELVAGGRRLEAVRRMGWVDVPVRVIASLDDAVTALKAELDENTHRKPLTPDELVEYGRRLEELEKPEAKKRQGTRTDLEPSTNLGGSSGETNEKVAAALGVVAETYRKAKRVAAAAEKEPERFGDLKEKMAAPGAKVDPLYRELKARRSAPVDPPPTPAPVPSTGPATKPLTAKAKERAVAKVVQAQLAKGCDPTVAASDITGPDAVKLLVVTTEFFEGKKGDVDTGLDPWVLIDLLEKRAAILLRCARAARRRHHL